LETRKEAAVALALLLVLPMLQTGPNVVNIAYGRSWPHSIVIDSSRQVAYVDGMSGMNPPDGFSFGVISFGNNSLGTVLGLPGIAGELALDAGSGTVYAAGQNSVSVIDGLNMSIERTIQLKIPVFSMAFDGSTGDLLLTSGDKVFQLDPASGRLVANATVGQSAEGMAVDTASGQVFVANYLSSSVSVLRATDLTTITTVHLPSPSYPSQIALDSKREVLYATTDGQSVVELSSKTYAVLGSIQVSHSSSNGTYALAIDPLRQRLFVAAEPGTVISELNETTGALISTLPLASAAYEMAVDQATGKLYVTNYHQVTAYGPTDVYKSGPSVPYLYFGALAGVALVVAGAVYVWKVRPNDGKRGGSARLRRTVRASLQ
jgi:DNA-binding beta-propeller fold protein YncE